MPGAQTYPRTRLPFLRQVVQTFIFLRLPSCTMVTCWMFGRNLRFTVRCEWLTERPATACLPQISQTFDMILTSNSGARADVVALAPLLLTKHRELYHNPSARQEHHPPTSGADGQSPPFLHMHSTARRPSPMVSLPAPLARGLYYLRFEEGRPCRPPAIAALRGRPCAPPARHRGPTGASLRAAPGFPQVPTADQQCNEDEQIAFS